MAGGAGSSEFNSRGPIRVQAIRQAALWRAALAHRCSIVAPQSGARNLGRPHGSRAGSVRHRAAARTAPSRSHSASAVCHPPTGPLAPVPHSARPRRQQKILHF